MTEEAQRTGVSGRVYTMDPAPIARGGQGSVWGGLRDDGLAVAIKVAEDTAVSRDALEREATLLSLLGERQVAGVAEVIDELDWDGLPAFVMPRYVEDANSHVQRLIQANRGVAVEAILTFVASLCRVLGALHRHKVPTEDGSSGLLVHRDVKPENVLVDSEGSVRLVDLGGTLIVDEFKAVRLAVFGSPLWAPYDQILPGLPEPNPTWDTYAATVVLFWWLSGTRPAYQADPTPMLTERGRAIWEALCELAHVNTEDREALVAAHRAFQDLREGTKEADLVVVRGHGALQPQDLAALTEGIGTLADPEIYGEEGLRLCVRDLGLVLSRGLSPLSHPSPPNRFWDAGELADELDLVRRRLVQAREARKAALDRQDMVARLADLDSRLLPPTAVPITSEQSSEDEGLDPVPRVARPGRPPTQEEVPAPSRARWLLGCLLGLLLFGLMSIPLAIGLKRWWADVSEEGASKLGPAAIPGGLFYAGDTLGDGMDDERPVRQVRLSPFSMDRTEVSNAEWKACMAAGACSPLAWMVAGSEHDPAGGKEGAAYQSLRGDDQPAVGVTHEQARVYCAWKGGRLPSEEEWEMAATWTAEATLRADKRRWPWGGAEPDCSKVNAAICGRNTTLQVGSLEEGASAFGVLHLAGNVWEWTSSRYPVESEKGRGLFRRPRAAQVQYVLRGGAFDTPTPSLRPTYRRHLAPSAVEATHGFRCVYDQG